MSNFPGRYTVIDKTAAEFTALNPVLLSGEFGFETDTGKFKIGNGASAWNSISTYYVPNGINSISNLGTGSSLLKEITANQLRARKIKAEDSSIVVTETASEIRLRATGVGSAVGVMPVFDIRNYGALVDGTTDDSAAVQDALEDAKPYGGGFIFSPRGTAKISSPVYLDCAPYYGNYIFISEAGAGRYLFTDLASEIGIYLANANMVKFQNLAIMGDQTNEYDSAASVIQTSFVDYTIFEDCIVAGLATSASGLDKGILNFGNTYARFKNCILAANVADASSLINLNGSVGLVMDTCYIVDYLNYNNEYINRVATWVAENQHTKHWIRMTNPGTLENTGVAPVAVSLKNIRIDEDTTESQILVDLNNKFTFDAENLSMNCGLDGNKAFDLRNLRRVGMRNSWFGYQPTSFLAGTIHNVGRAILDNVQMDQGADSIELTGTTARLDMSQCSGFTVTNAAGATINTD